MTWTSAAGWQRKNQLLFCQVLYCSLLNIYIHDSFETIVLEELIQIGSFICLVQDIFLIHLEIDHLLCLRCNVTCMLETNCQDVLWDARIGSGSPLQLIRLLSKTALTGSSPSACDTASRHSDVMSSSPVHWRLQTVMNFYRCMIL